MTMKPAIPAMAASLTGEERLAIIRRTYQEAIGMLLFISGETEMQRLPARDAAGALRLAAGLTKELTLLSHDSPRIPGGASYRGD
jgi:hypothetical protein